MTGWKKLGNEDFDGIRSVRDNVHLAIQNVSALGRSYSFKSNNDEFAALNWIEQSQRLAGYWISNEKTKIRSSFSFPDFSIYLINDAMETVSQLELEGKKHTDIMVWLEEQVANQGFDTSPLHFKLPYEVPHFSNIRNKPFTVQPTEHIIELASYYHNAYLICNAVKKGFGLTSETICWPHHFDLATLLTIKDTGDSETSTSIGVGMSPGNLHEPIPYFYVAPWPYPNDPDALPGLSTAKWVQDQWVGAKLDMRDIIQFKSAADQYQIVTSFVEEAINHLSPHLSV